MKNQYFGDTYDYIKYILLRQLGSCGKVSTAICWMLTENDDRRDGHRVNYLQEAEAWRIFDPPVFDCLRTAILDRNERNIRVVEESGLLPNTSFYSPFLADGSDERREYFDGFMEFSSGREFLFFDPDNGLEIKSVMYGRRGASRYLFLSEVCQSYSAGCSLLVYQHIPPKPRAPFFDDLATRLMRETGSEAVYVFHTQRVAFFLVPQTSLAGHFEEIAYRVETNWGNLLSVRRYPATRKTVTG